MKGYSIACCGHSNEDGRKFYHISYKEREFVRDMINPHYETVTIYSVVCEKCLKWYKKELKAKVIERYC